MRGHWCADKNLIISIIISLVVILGSCEKEPIDWETILPETDKDSSKNEAPFDNVPITSDIVMYEVNISAFSEDGTLNGVRSGLESLKDLGVNVVWLMPIHPIGELKGIGSPYAVQDYNDVNPDFGTIADLKMLVREAHELDMAVILDWVANHTAWDHAWIKNKSWYMQDASGNIVSPDGWNDVAELDFSSSAMRDEMIKAMVYWIEEANIDGYRCDVADGVPSYFWTDAIDKIRSDPDRTVIMFAEGTRTNLFNSGFNLTFGWDFYNKLKSIYTNSESVYGLVSENKDEYLGVPAGSHILRFTSNHDFNAWDDTPINIFNGIEGSMAAFVLTSYMGGVPLLYSGQEVGCPTKLGFFANSSTKIDWTLNPELRAEYKKLIEFRKSSDAVKNGSIESYAAHTGVLAFKRISGSEEVLVIVNVRNSTTVYELPEKIANTTWLDLMNNEEVILGETVEMNPLSYYILK